MNNSQILDQDKPKKAKKSYNVNPLTLEPGGCTVGFKFSDGKIETHPRIKFVIPYVKKVITESALEGRQLTEARIVSTDKLIWDGRQFYKL